MNYSAQILSTIIQNGVLNITVQYTASDGSDTFTENITTSTSQADGWLDQVITDRLNTLNDLVSYNVNSVQNDQVMTASLSVDSTQTLITTPISVTPITTSLGKVS